MKPKPRFAIGIDAGVNTGYAIYDRHLKSLVSVYTLDFWDTINELEFAQDCEVFIEDVTQNKPTFNRNVNQKAFTRISQNVGSNKRDCQLIIEYCERNDIKITKVRPTAKSMTKLNQEAFIRITGYTDKTSQHGRDSAMLCFGR